jgi:heme exporter protein D
MIWNSVGDFFAMGGYGLYVWGSTMRTTCHRRPKTPWTKPKK